MTLALPQHYLDQMVAHAREEAPNECCGIIAGKDGRAVKLFRAVNAEASPFRYSVEPKDQLRILHECQNHGWDHLAFYHSHTASQAYPSPTDIRLAFTPEVPGKPGERMLWWPDAYWIIVSLEDADNPVVRAFRILPDGAVSEEEIRAE
ncbi:MAG: M67 family metallopeptidase [Dehalococcoidia bacterium]|nr:M67 family metallopeptidase [Dehalococcoidia bacterium]